MGNGMLFQDHYGPSDGISVSLEGGTVVLDDLHCRVLRAPLNAVLAALAAAQLRYDVILALVAAEAGSGPRV
jgi:hypothetical protein